MIPLARRSSAIVLFALAAHHPQVRAQAPDSLARGWQGARELVTIGSTAEDRLRVDQILGRAPTDGFLIRSASSLSSRSGSPARDLRWNLIAPQLLAVSNSDLPFSLNDGALWAGRGLSLELMAGAHAERGRISITLAPEILYEQNRDFQVIPATTNGRSQFSSPWYGGAQSADLPLRFGNQSLAILDPGQSAARLDLGAVTLGASTENQWWGPGIRNAIVMSNNAAGVPHLFLETARPIRTRAGEFEAKWLIGGLSESLYFDTIHSGAGRSLSALAATYRPRWEPTLTVGLARTVYAGSDPKTVPLHLFDVFVRGGQHYEVGDSVHDGSPDQILSLFGRWIFPEDGLEVYGEWARVELPRSARDYLVAPNHSQGYTLGVQWAHPARPGSVVRLQSELTNLEESTTFRTRPVPQYYLSRTVRQGYTQRGQVIGASIGPGSSSQWLAMDYLAPHWQAGVFGGRIRWEEYAHETSQPTYWWQTGRTNFSHDVSMLGGVRAGWQLGRLDVSTELVVQQRYNYLFQNPELGFKSNPRTDGTVDVRNYTLRLVLTPDL